MNPNVSDIEIEDFVWSDKGNGYIESIDGDKITIRLIDDEKRIISKTDINNIAYKARHDG